METKKASFWLWLLIGLTVACFWLRVHALDSESLWVDEVYTVNLSQRSISEITRLATGDIHPPLYYWVVHFWIGQTGTSEFAARLLSVFFGVLAIPLGYRVASAMFGSTCGALTATLLTVSPYHIYYSQEARSYALLVPLGLLSFHALIRIYERNDRWAKGIYVLTVVLMLYTQVYGFTIWAAHNLYWVSRNTFLKSTSRVKLRTWLGLQAAVLTLFVPWAGVLHSQIARVQQGFWLPRPTPTMLVGHFLLYAGSIPSAFLILLSGTVAAGYAVVRRQVPDGHLSGQVGTQKLSYSLVMVGLWLLLPHLIPLGISLIATPIYVLKGTLVGLAAFHMTIAWALATIPSTRLRLALLAALCISQAYDNYQAYQQIDKQQWREVAQMVEISSRASDLILFYPEYAQDPFDHYARRTDLAKTKLVDLADLEDMALSHARIWVVVIPDAPVSNDAPFEPAYLSPPYQLVAAQRFVAVDVYQFRR